MNILENLVSKNIISKGDSIKIEKQASASDKTVEQILEEVGIPTQTILDVKSEYYNVPSINLENYTVPFAVLKYVSEDAAAHYKFVPISQKDGLLEIGMVDPDNIESRDALNFILSKLNLPYKIYVISEKDLKKIIESYKGLSGEVSKALTELETDLDDELEDIEIIKSDYSIEYKEL